jgi:hypothetical protein
VPVRKALLGAALISTLLLSGCTAAAPKPTPTPSATIADLAVRPLYPSSMTAVTAQKETERLADAIDDIIEPTSVQYIDRHSVMVPATGTTKRAWGVLRTLTLTPTLDPAQVASSVVAVLQHSGWVLLHNTTDTGTTVIALASGTRTSTAWYLLVSGDASKVGQSVVTVQLESPAIP